MVYIWSFWSPPFFIQAYQSSRIVISPIVPELKWWMATCICRFVYICGSDHQSAWSRATALVSISRMVWESHSRALGSIWSIQTYLHGYIGFQNTTSGQLCLTFQTVFFGLSETPPLLCPVALHYWAYRASINVKHWAPNSVIATSNEHLDDSRFFCYFSKKKHYNIKKSIFLFP
jgi:hypothetical protein